MVAAAGSAGAAGFRFFDSVRFGVGHRPVRLRVLLTENGKKIIQEDRRSLAEIRVRAGRRQFSGHPDGHLLPRAQPYIG